MIYRSALFLLALNLINNATGQRVAIAHLRDGNVTGTVTFTETDAGLRVTGIISGLAAGEYGFHIHELGDTDTCTSAGTHYNPDGNNHAGRDDAVRHVGDLGNIVFVGDIPVAVLDFVDTVITLRGRNSILGRTLVLHEERDDLGLGDADTDTLITGNAGGRVACGVIGIKYPVEPWNSAASITPSILLFISALTVLSYVF